VLLHGIGRRFPPRHATKAVVAPARTLQPEQQVAPDGFARAVGLVSGSVPAEMLFLIGADFTRDLPRCIIAKALLLVCSLVLLHCADVIVSSPQEGDYILV